MFLVDLVSKTPACNEIQTTEGEIGTASGEPSFRFDIYQMKTGEFIQTKGHGVEMDSYSMSKGQKGLMSKHPTKSFFLRCVLCDIFKESSPKRL